MDLLKLVFDSYVQLIGHVAWPLFILIILLIFRMPIIKLIGGPFEVWYGRLRAKFNETEEGETKTIIPPVPIAPAVTETKAPDELTKEARKILTTLWRRQTHHYHNDFSRHWSFRVVPNSRVYGTFIVGFAELLKVGHITWEPKYGQAVLTNKGIEYLKDNKEIRESDDFYAFQDN